MLLIVSVCALRDLRSLCASDIYIESTNYINVVQHKKEHNHLKFNNSFIEIIIIIKKLFL